MIVDYYSYRRMQIAMGGGGGGLAVIIHSSRRSESSPEILPRNIWRLSLAPCRRTALEKEQGHVQNMHVTRVQESKLCTVGVVNC